MQLVECVPNFSEGRDREVIDRITAEISGTSGAMLLDVDPGMATNRTVVTFVAPPEAAIEAAFRAIRKAGELIDMARHSGEHARFGATDVCPFIPVQGITREECIELCRVLGKRVGEELGIPVYHYGYAATRPERRRLPDIRAGEYEALPEKLKDPDFAPDWGEAVFNARSGVTAIGVREFLIAWNLNLNTVHPRLGEKIARELRETGKVKRDANGRLVRDAEGNTIQVPGRFTELQGGAWYIDEYGRAQISFNIMNHKVTPMHEVYEAACEEADKLGVRVTGSEIVGLVPLDAMLAAGDHFHAKQGRSSGVPELERIHIAALSMGLGELKPFDPLEKIIEYRYRGGPTGLKAMRMWEFADELSTHSPAPGGGSVAALSGALSAALSSMVAALTHPKRKYRKVRDEMLEVGRGAQELKDFFIDAVDADTDAFNEVLAARRLPQGTEAEQAARLEAIELASQEATRVPLRVLERAVAALELAQRVATSGLAASVSDAGVAGACARAAAEGAALNVRINLPGLTDRTVATEIDQEMRGLLARAHELADQVRATVDEALD
jgi:glutamate formiminotransferase/formiminotetrahydrofolate cyclodeaminase